MDVVLVSGGVDSTILAFNMPDAQRLFVSYGQKYANCEDEAVHNLFDNVSQVTIGHKVQSDISGFIPARNLLLASIAVAYLGADRILFSAHADDRRPDKTPTEFERMSQILSIHADKKVEVLSPYWTISKPDLVRDFVAKHPDGRDILSKTYSCYSGVKGGCGYCRACVRKFTVFTLAGIPYPIPDKNAIHKALNEWYLGDMDRTNQLLKALELACI